jgi:hypothetical protein
MYDVFYLQLAPLSGQKSCEVMADSVQLEFSAAIVEAIDKLVRVTLPLFRRLLLCRLPSAAEQESSSSLWSNANVYFQCTNFNLFVSCENSGNN